MENEQLHVLQNRSFKFQQLTSINKASFSAFWERSSLEFQTNET
jgi:hypothetical protein